ncbi:protein kinase domain-containing protein [Singulisphaera acidiphila]|uniref:Protein kinase family protein n=1 Tax=Singulisphaera acidiphila (strain ATCC BAA-1392 / DSM 18658 / VKM B-2454 / MOB10) TaxID=886293 RepID=L0D9Y1_SINAD|nr:serine/threonine-protein kinase [Singulisphaera acidiphila]AGA25643.1 protein kinase family protein [Singulisphaera acidiphila DSM 18658]
MNSDSVDNLLDSLWQGRLVEPAQLKELAVGDCGWTVSTPAVAADLVRRGVLTAFQAAECLAGRGAELAVGPYRLLEPLGTGARGPVFRARHESTNQVVAIKTFPPDRQPRADSTEAHRFHREAEAAARLHHPHLVSVLDDGTSGGVHYLVMELVEGIDLLTFLEFHGPLEPLQACRYAEQAARALQHTYEHRLVPCEITASDFIVTDRGDTVKLLGTCRGRLGPSARGLGEFDLGSLLEPGAAGQDETTRDAEALREDAQSALAGLGRVLLLMVSGRRTQGDDEAEHPPNDEELATPLPAKLALIVGTMMADNPAQRYATPADCAAALARFDAHHTPAHPEPTSITTFKAPKTGGALSLAHSSLAFVVMIGLGMLAGAATTWFSSHGPTATTTQRPVTSGSSSVPSSLPAERPVENPPLEDPQYRALMQAGTANLNRNAIPEALVRLGEAIRLRPDLAAAYTRRAEASARWEAYPDVVADCNQAIRLAPSDAVAYRLRGAALAYLGDEGGAIADSTKAIELDARDAHAFNTRGVAHFNRREFRAALDDFTAAVGIDESLAGALGNLSWLLATAPDSGIRNGLLAIKHAKRACELTAWEDPVQLKNLAAAHAECREFDQAIPFQKLALARSRGLPGTIADQYRSLLKLYQAGQSAPTGGSPPDPERTTSPHQAPPLPVPAPASSEMRRGVEHLPGPFPTFRDIPRSAPLPFVPLYRSGFLLIPHMPTENRRLVSLQADPLPRSPIIFGIPRLSRFRLDSPRRRYACSTQRV